jgi:5-methyltetrahydropteroyltriglutamate--homocysteine methyltransferase
MTLPRFPVTTVGSWPRSPELLRAVRERRRGEIAQARFTEIARAGVRDAVRSQLAAGVDLVTDGEQTRDNFYSFVAEKLDSVRLMTLAEMLDLVEDKEGFSQLLETLDVPAFAISNPTCVGPIRLRESLAVDDLQYLRTLTDRPVKVTLPGPYLLTRAMWVPEASRDAYPDKEALSEDVVAILGEEIARLARAGVDFVQLDEPVLTELVFTQGRTRTFMCAALGSRRDPAEELEFALALLSRVVPAAADVRTGLHVCRGNWSRDESTLLAGGYAPLAPWFERAPVDQLVLEYATPRAGEFVAVGGKEIGLGVVNPRSDEIEDPGDIVRQVERVLEQVGPERVFLNPDCGFGTFAARPMNAVPVAEAKLASMAAAARTLRERFGDPAEGP